jgi:hypothetical protein
VNYTIYLAGVAVFVSQLTLAAPQTSYVYLPSEQVSTQGRYSVTTQPVDQRITLTQQQTLATQPATVAASSEPKAVIIKTVNSNPFYVGLGVGFNKYQFHEVPYSSLGMPSDESSRHIKLFGGWIINKHFSAEMHYADFDDYSVSGSNGDQYDFAGDTIKMSQGNTLGDSVNVNAGFSAAGLSVLLKAPLERIQPYFRLGVNFWNSDAVESGSSSSVTMSKDGINPLYGLGVNISMPKAFFIRAEIERYEFDGDGVKLYSMGIIYKF